MAAFKPNIYPIMYWGLLYGLIAGFVLFLFFMLSQYITVIWFPIFLAGVIWGGYRNYSKQKSQAGARVTQAPAKEFQEAAKDIMSATREMLSEQIDEATKQGDQQQNGAGPVDSSETEPPAEAGAGEAPAPPAAPQPSEERPTTNQEPPRPPQAPA